MFFLSPLITKPEIPGARVFVFALMGDEQARMLSFKRCWCKANTPGGTPRGGCTGEHYKFVIRPRQIVKFSGEDAAARLLGLDVQSS